MSAETPSGVVAVALSGGVDSSVAAALLLQQGHQVIGVTLKQYSEARQRGGSGAGGPSLEQIARARRTCELLRIPFRVLDAQAPFRSAVIDYLVSEYASGRTPNPCVPCNRHIRFGLLLKEALALGADRLATGHFARLREAGGRRELLRGVDPGKDQSYFLHALDQSQLARCLFPLGELTKAEVRVLASQLGLPSRGAPESQDICFLAGGDYRPFLAREAPALLRPGPILDADGCVLGHHQGLACYTVGQRKGLGMAAPEPLYVVSILAAENALVVGTRDKLRCEGCWVEQIRYISGAPPGSSFRAAAQVRHRSHPATATVSHDSADQAYVHFDTPQFHVAPGQFLVLYDGETVLGGGAICEPSRSVL